jgi:phosphoglycerate dehydrogenase-like enzyme
MTPRSAKTPPLRIVVAEPNLLPHRARFEAGLPAGAQVQWHPWFDETTVATDLPGAQVYVGSRFTGALGGVADDLALVHVAGAGYDGIDQAAVPADAVVANTFHHEASIAEYVMATTVMLRRGLVEQDRALRADEWASSVYQDLPQPVGLAGATVGIIGFGHIGAEVWRVMQAVGVRGIAVSRRKPSLNSGLEWSGSLDDLDRLLGESDVVVLCLPLVPETRGLIGTAALDRMRSDATLVNVSRGPLVDEDALFTALQERRIGGAVLDVWYSYPTSGSTRAPSTQPFGELSNVLLTPHISGVTRQTFEGRVDDITANIRRLVDGAPIRNVVITGPAAAKESAR